MAREPVHQPRHHVGAACHHKYQPFAADMTPPPPRRRHRGRPSAARPGVRLRRREKGQRAAVSAGCGPGCHLLWRTAASRSARRRSASPAQSPARVRARALMRAGVGVRLSLSYARGRARL